MQVLATQNIKDKNIFNTMEFAIEEINDNQFRVTTNGLNKRFSEPPSFFFFFSYPSNIEIIFDFSDFSDWGGENSPPISKSWIRACFIPSFCATVYKYQGGDIDEHYNVYDVDN